MKKSNTFGQSVTAALVAANIVHLLWTFWLVDEQIETGWGYGTNMDLGVLYPWLTELLCAPVMLTAVVYLVMGLLRKYPKRNMIVNLILFCLAAAQFALVNLFIWF